MSSSIEDKLENLNLSNDEMKSIAEAFKKEEFKKLFAEYAEEISDPENRARYEKEISELENERGMDVKFVKPSTGHVLKTTVNGKTKGFINVCHNENVGKPSSKKNVSENGKQGLSWSVPHLFSPQRDDYTKDKQKCLVYDFVVHPDTYHLGESNDKFRKMINDMAVDGVEKMFNVELDRKNVKGLKMKYKGAIVSTVIRNKITNAEVKEMDKDDILSQCPYPYGTETSEEKTQKVLKVNAENKKMAENKQKNIKVKTPEVIPELGTRVIEDKFTEPKYEIKYQSRVDYEDFIMRQDVTLSTRPRNLLLSINLPLITSAATLTLDVFSNRVILVSHKPAKYKLDLALPYKVDEDASSAKFDKTLHKLSLTLPVIPAEPSKVSFITDEGANEEVETSEKVDEGGSLKDGVRGNDFNKKYESEKEENIFNNDFQKNEYFEKSDKSFEEHKEKLENNEVEKRESMPNEMPKACLYSVKPATDSGIEDNTPHIEETNEGERGVEAHDDVINITSVCKLAKGIQKLDDSEEDHLTENKGVVMDLHGCLVDNKKENKNEAENDEIKCDGMKNDEIHNVVMKNVEIKYDETENSEEIVVVYEKERPKLHGILKSRTSSESSSSQESEEDNSTTSPIFSSGSKKCVSFSEHVDETVYRINQSVSTLHATLKNRNKKKEKRDAAKLKQEARRRKTSGSMSSGDELNHLTCNPIGRKLKGKNVTIVNSKKMDSDDDHTNDSEGFSSTDQLDSDAFEGKDDKDEEHAKNLGSDTNPKKVVDSLEQHIGRGKRRRSKKGKKSKDETSTEKIDASQKGLIQVINPSATQTFAKQTTEAASSMPDQHEHSKSILPPAPAEQPDTILSWKEPDLPRNVQCAIQLENDQVFCLDLN